MTTIAGSGEAGFADGQGRNAMFNCLDSICFSRSHDCLFVSDSDNHKIRIINLKTGIEFILSLFFSCTNKGNVTSIGNGKPGCKDGISEEAQFNKPTGIANSESDGSLLVCDNLNHKIRKITFEGIFTSLYSLTDL